MNNWVLARLSLAFLWLWTALTSVVWGKDIGYQVLARADIYGGLADFCVYAGAFLDMLLGFWLLCGCYLNACYRCQLFVIVLYTLLLTVIDISFWLHPFGPLSKNLPILVLIVLLLQNKHRSKTGPTESV